MRVTMKQIAEKSGLAYVTVSRILSGNGEGHSAETRRRVLSVAQEMGYRANVSARAVRSGKFDAIALLLSHDRVLSLLPMDLLSGVHDALMEWDQRLLVTRLTDQSLTDPDFVPQILRESCADGLLINYNSLIPPRLIELVAQNNLPVMWINSKQEADCLYPDDFGAMQEAVRQLVALGHRRIAYIDYVNSTHYSRIDRRAGYEAGMAEAALSPRIIPEVDGVPLRDFLEVTLGWMEVPSEERPTAVILYSPQMLEIIFFVAERLHMVLPRDLSIITVDSVDKISPQGLKVGKMLLPEAQIGREAVVRLMEKINTRSQSFAPYAVPMTYDPGDTCIPPRGS